MSDKITKDKETITRLIGQIVKLEALPTQDDSEGWLLRFLRKQLQDVVESCQIDYVSGFVIMELQKARGHDAATSEDIDIFIAGLTVSEVMVRIRRYVESATLSNSEARELEALLDRMLDTPLDEMPEPDSPTAQVVAKAIGAHAAKLRKMQEPAPAETCPPITTVIKLTPAEIRTGHDRVKWAEGLIRQLPLNHDGRNSWLLNYGTEGGINTADEDGKDNPEASPTDMPCTCGPDTGCAWCQGIPAADDNTIGADQDCQEAEAPHVPTTVMELIEHHIALRVEQDMTQFALESASDAMHSARHVLPKNSPDAMLLLRAYKEKAEDLASHIATAMRPYHHDGLRKKYANALIDLCMRPAPVAYGETVSARVATDRIESPYGQDTEG